MGIERKHSFTLRALNAASPVIGFNFLLCLVLLMSILIFLSLSVPQFCSYKITLLSVFCSLPPLHTLQILQDGDFLISIEYAVCSAAWPRLCLREGRKALSDTLEFLYFENMSLALDCEAGTALNARVTPTANSLW